MPILKVHYVIFKHVTFFQTMIIVKLNLLVQMMTMMTISLIIVTLIMGTDALKIQAPSNVVYTKQFSTVDETDFTVLDPKPQPPTRILAKWFPFGGLKAPKALDGELAADVGFDPIGQYTCIIFYSLLLCYLLIL